MLLGLWLRHNYSGNGLTISAESSAKVKRIFPFKRYRVFFCCSLILRIKLREDPWVTLLLCPKVFHNNFADMRCKRDNNTTNGSNTSRLWHFAVVKALVQIIKLLTQVLKENCSISSVTFFMVWCTILRSSAPAGHRLPPIDRDCKTSAKIFSKSHALQKSRRIPRFGLL